MHRQPDYSELAKEAVNNWKRFDSFGLADAESYEGFTIVYTSNRDSRLIERVNAECIDKMMRRHMGNGTCRRFSANHWACGHVDGYAIKVFTKKGKITAAFKAMCDINAALADYPVLDDSALSQAEDEEIKRICDNEGWDINDDEAYERARSWANEG